VTLGARPAPRGERGFTFIEVTVVLIIIAIGTVLAVPMIEGRLESREVRRAARQVASTMTHARGEALSRGEPQEVLIDTEKNAIATTGWGRWAGLSERASIERVEGGQSLGDGVVQILFYPNGSTSGASVLLTSRADRTRNRLIVHLDPLVGTLTVEDASL